ncbi:MAG: hypothetical protein WKF84_24935 [Pyrinomonadaceae bacterium]
MMKDDPAIAGIREVRHRISAEHDHDPRKVVGLLHQAAKAISRSVDREFRAKKKKMTSRLKSADGSLARSGIDSAG